jgi:sarcosine oxidase/L-pipecolate oxidase
VTAKSWAVTHLQLTPEEAKTMVGMPVINCRDLGFFFEPDPDNGLIKLSSHGAGYTNYKNEVSLPSTSNDGIPEMDEELIHRLIEETMPQFAGRPLVNKFICWCSDTADSDYIIDFVPGYENLIIAAGDSGHAFKMLPVAGKWVTRVLEEGKQNIQRWKWKEDVKGGAHDISWRVGKLRDIKDVKRRT